MVYYSFKANVIRKKNGFRVVMDHVRAWRDLILSAHKGPGFGMSIGARIEAADHDSSRRTWGKQGVGGEWEHGGAVTVDAHRGQVTLS